MKQEDNTAQIEVAKAGNNKYYKKLNACNTNDCYCLLRVGDQSNESLLKDDPESNEEREAKDKRAKERKEVRAGGGRQKNIKKQYNIETNRE